MCSVSTSGRENVVVLTCKYYFVGVLDLTWLQSQENG